MFLLRSHRLRFRVDPRDHRRHRTETAVARIDPRARSCREGDIGPRLDLGFGDRAPRRRGLRDAALDERHHSEAQGLCHVVMTAAVVVNANQPGRDLLEPHVRELIEQSLVVVERQPAVAKQREERLRRFRVPLRRVAPFLDAHAARAESLRESDRLPGVDADLRTVERAIDLEERGLDIVEHHFVLARAAEDDHPVEHDPSAASVETFRVRDRDRGAVVTEPDVATHAVCHARLRALWTVEDARRREMLRADEPILGGHRDIEMQSGELAIGQ